LTQPPGNTATQGAAIDTRESEALQWRFDAMFTDAFVRDRGLAY